MVEVKQDPGVNDAPQFILYKGGKEVIRVDPENMNTLQEVIAANKWSPVITAKRANDKAWEQVGMSVKSPCLNQFIYHAIQCLLSELAK